MAETPEEKDTHTFEPFLNLKERSMHSISAPSGLFSTGDWQVVVLPKTRGGLGVGLRWKGARSATGVSLALDLYDSQRNFLHPCRLPVGEALPFPGTEFPSYSTGHKLWRLDCDQEEAAYGKLTCTFKISRPKLGVVADLASLLTLHPNNVRFFFPSSNRELFANAELLKAASPYFATLLGPDFAEGRKVAPAVRARKIASIADGSAPSGGFDDSDAEDEESLGEEGGSAVGTAQEGDLACSTPFHEVMVEEFAFKTYQAVLLYLKTGEIEFSRLSSSSATTFTAADDEVLASPRARPLTENSSVLPSASPKSVYRLARFLSLAELAELALTVFQEQLTIDNIVLELFTDFSAVFPEVADVVVDFAVEHWEKVKKSSAMKQLAQRSEREGGEMPSVIVLKLLLRL